MTRKMKRFTLIESYEASIAALEHMARENDKAAFETWGAVIMLRKYLEEAKRQEQSTDAV